MLYEIQRKNGKKVWGEYILRDTIARAKDGDKISIFYIDKPTKIITITEEKNQ